VGKRTDFVVAVDESDRTSIDGGCAAVLDLLLPFATAATLDGYIGWPDPPPRVLAVQQRLIEKHGEDGLMSLAFDLSVPEDRTDFLALAPWSINAQMADEAGTVLVSISDGGTSLVGCLTDDEAAQLREGLSERGHPEIEVVPGDEWDARRRHRKRQERAAARVTDRLRF